MVNRLWNERNIGICYMERNSKSTNYYLLLILPATPNQLQCVSNMYNICELKGYTAIKLS